MQLHINTRKTHAHTSFPSHYLPFITLSCCLLVFFSLSRSVKHKHTSGRCSLPMQWKRTETTSGIRVSLITLRHIVLSNSIHCTHLGVNLRSVQPLGTPIHHCPSFHLSPPPSISIAPGFVSIYFPSFLFSFLTLALSCTPIYWPNLCPFSSLFFKVPEHRGF